MGISQPRQARSRHEVNASGQHSHALGKATQREPAHQMRAQAPQHTLLKTICKFWKRMAGKQTNLVSGGRRAMLVHHAIEFRLLHGAMHPCLRPLTCAPLLSIACAGTRARARTRPHPHVVLEHALEGADVGVAIAELEGLQGDLCVLPMGASLRPAAHPPGHPRGGSGRTALCRRRAMAPHAIAEWPRWPCSAHLCTNVYGQCASMHQATMESRVLRHAARPRTSSRTALLRHGTNPTECDGVPPRQ